MRSLVPVDSMRPVDPALIAAGRLDGDTSLAAFRVLAEAASRPGRIVRIVSEELRRLPTVALAPLALLDLDSTLCVLGVSGEDSTPPDHAAEIVASLVHASTAATLVADPAAADMVVAIEHLTADVVETLRRGSAEQPESGTRLVIAADTVTQLDADTVDATEHALVIDATGPGVDVGIRFTVTGVDTGALRALADIDEFPAGVDTWITTEDGHVVALPRSTRFTVEEVD